MARFSLIKGWLECSFEDVVRVENLVSEHWRASDEYLIKAESIALYRAGWTFPKKPINWISLVFFGANVDEKAVPFIFDCLKKIAESGMEIEGYFHVDDEDEEDLRLWVIEGGKLWDSPRIVSSK